MITAIIFIFSFFLKKDNYCGKADIKIDKKEITLTYNNKTEVYKIKQHKKGYWLVKRGISLYTVNYMESDYGHKGYLFESMYEAFTVTETNPCNNED